MVHEEKPIIAERVKKIISDKMGLEVSSINDTDLLYDELGMDSLDAIELEMELEKEYSIDIPDEELEKWKTVNDAVEYLDSVINTLGI